MQNKFPFAIVVAKFLQIQKHHSNMLKQKKLANGRSNKEGVGKLKSKYSPISEANSILRVTWFFRQYTTKVLLVPWALNIYFQALRRGWKGKEGLIETGVGEGASLKLLILKKTVLFSKLLPHNMYSTRSCTTVTSLVFS